MKRCKTHIKPNENQSQILRDYEYCMDFVASNPHLMTPEQMRWALRNRKRNGLDKAIVRLGRRLFIHVPSFIVWIESQRGQS